MDEALPLHSGRADPIDCPKCGQLGCVIFVSGGLRSRYPLINQPINCKYSENGCVAANVPCTVRQEACWNPLRSLLPGRLRSPL